MTNAKLLNIKIIIFQITFMVVEKNLYAYTEGSCFFKKNLFLYHTGKQNRFANLDNKRNVFIVKFFFKKVQVFFLTIGLYTSFESEIILQ